MYVEPLLVRYGITLRLHSSPSKLQGVPFLCLSTRQLSWHVPAVAGFQCDKAKKRDERNALYFTGLVYFVLYLRFWKCFFHIKHCGKSPSLICVTNDQSICQSELVSSPIWLKSWKITGAPSPRVERARAWSHVGNVKRTAFLRNSKHAKY